MLARFSLYGFLKNQRYYEPFIILFFLEKGLSFAQIGLLVAFREFWINIAEIPSGALADLYGRRRCMVLSFGSYLLAFLLFGVSRSYPHLFGAMFFFAIGEAFRTGTHKAMIFTWLRLQGRKEDKTLVYGYTRSWSKLGSAFSIILATLFVMVHSSYASVFYYSMIPYLMGLLNFMGYPRELEGRLELYHWSWMTLVTLATVLLSSADEEFDPEQHFILKEVLRYFSHENTDVRGFHQMNPEWSPLLQSVHSGAATHKSHPHVVKTICAWHQEQSDICLILSRKLKLPVTLRLRKHHRDNQTARVEDDAED